MMLTAAVLAAACIAVEGDRILARDLASAVPALAALGPDEALAYAPAPGSRRILTRRELARLGAQHGIELEVETSVCVERAMERLSAERVTAALRAAIARDDARLELLDFSRHPVPRGELEFPHSGLGVAPGANLPVLWRGRLRYAGSRSVPVWARVRISLRGPRVIAEENLPAGQVIAAGKVRVVETECPFAAEQPAVSLEEVIGRAPRRAVRRGSPILRSLLADPQAVERGDAVTVEVSSGAAQLKLQARAESAGNPGDVVLLRNPAGGRRFPARVEARGKVRIER